jgi:hypothetical protein
MKEITIIIIIIIITTTPWCRDLRENLMVSQLGKNFSAFYGNRKFITVSTTARPYL